MARARIVEANERAAAVRMTGEPKAHPVSDTFQFRDELMTGARLGNLHRTVERAPECAPPTQGVVVGGGSGGLAVFAAQFQLVGSAAA